MIVGIGNDIIEISRIKKAAERAGFMDKYFTKAEQHLFEERHFNPGTIGGNFSVKEAVSKALGTGVRDFNLDDIEVLRNELGKPYVILYKGALKAANALGINQWHVSISHCKTTITAMVIGEKI